MQDTTATAAFDRILDAEHEVRVMKTIVAFRDSRVSPYRAEQQDASLAAAQQRLSDAIDALPVERAAEFAAYRAKEMTR